jgi:hypothetical protein
VGLAASMAADASRGWVGGKSAAVQKAQHRSGEQRNSRTKVRLLFRQERNRKPLPAPD